MKRMMLFLVLGLLPVWIGVQHAASAPITGTVQIEMRDHEKFMIGCGLFGNVPSEGAITEVATAEWRGEVRHLPSSIAIPLPVYQDDTVASIDDVFFTLVAEKPPFPFPSIDDWTLVLEYAGGSNIDVVNQTGYADFWHILIKAWAVRTVPISLAAETPVTEVLQLSQNRPNPFRPPTAIAFDLPRAGDVRLEVFDVSGQRVAVVLDRSMGAGSHTVRWDGRSDAGAQLQPGQYYYRIATDHGVRAKKMIMLK